MFLIRRLHVLDDPSTTPSTVHAMKLVSATHALSSYNLRVTPSGSITPAQIRMHNDPAIIVSSAIENNPTSYRGIDRMLKILDDLIDGIQLFKQSSAAERELGTRRMEARVLASIVEAALSQNDFSTAYKVCTMNLDALIRAHPKDKVIKQASWPAFYHTATHSSSTHGRPSSHGAATHAVDDSQRMELLARAVLICSKTEIHGVLRVWMDLERKLLYPEQPPLASHQSSAEDHNRLLATYAGNSGLEVGSFSDTAGESRGSGLSSSRFGVRDTVKTGLTQGIGWLLGATPSPNAHQ
jgi:hypothetical protein